MIVQVDSRKVKRLRKKLEAFGPAYEAALEMVFDEVEEYLLEATKRHASGRPGPQIVTGEYRASIYTVRPASYAVYATSTAPQSRRLEKGFYGADSLGRVYAQPPFPHFGPAQRETYSEYKRVLRKLPRQVWRSLK